VPLKILNFSSTRGRGLRSDFSSGKGGAFFSAFSVGVTKVAISELSAVSFQPSAITQRVGSRLRAESGSLKADSWFLAGPLGFEPRQSAPKALDLPLVDGPVNIVD
jgi:hypothetical protein